MDILSYYLDNCQIQSTDWSLTGHLLVTTTKREQLMATFWIQISRQFSVYPTNVYFQLIFQTFLSEYIPLKSGNAISTDAPSSAWSVQKALRLLKHDLFLAHLTWLFPMTIPSFTFEKKLQADVIHNISRGGDKADCPVDPQLHLLTLLNNEWNYSFFLTFRYLPGILFHKKSCTAIPSPMSQHPKINPIHPDEFEYNQLF